MTPPRRFTPEELTDVAERLETKNESRIKTEIEDLAVDMLRQAAADARALDELNQKLKSLLDFTQKEAPHG
jgi:hypothetical protein